MDRVLKTNLHAVPWLTKAAQPHGSKGARAGPARNVEKTRNAIRAGADGNGVEARRAAWEPRTGARRRHRSLNRPSGRAANLGDAVSAVRPQLGRGEALAVDLHRQAVDAERIRVRFSSCRR